MRGEDKIISDELRQHGLRATAPRRAVLSWLAPRPHATADEVFHGVASEFGTVSKQAVYDVLSACVAAGMVRRIKLAGHPARFECRTGDNHHHLVCRQCGSVADTGCRADHAPCMSPSETHGFSVDTAEVVFWGLCRTCRDAEDWSVSTEGGES